MQFAGMDTCALAFERRSVREGLLEDFATHRPMGIPPTVFVGTNLGEDEKKEDGCVAVASRHVARNAHLQIYVEEIFAAKTKKRLLEADSSPQYMCKQCSTRQ